MTQRWARVGRNDHVRVCVCACVRVTTRVEGSQPNAPVVEKDPRCFQGLRVCVVPYTSSELVVHEVLELDVLVHGEGLGLLENGHDLLLLHFALQVAWPHTQEKRERSGECCALSDPQNDTDGWIRSSRSGAPSNSCALTFQGRDAVKDHDGLEVPVGFANHPGGPHVSWNFLLHHLIGLAKELVHLDAGGLVGNLALDHTADLAQIEGNGKGGGGGRCRRKSDASFSHRARWEFGAAVAVVVDGVPHEDPALARVQFRSSPTSPDQTHLVDWDLGVRPDGLPLRSVGDDASKAEGPPGRGADGVRKHDDDDGFTGFSWPHVVVLNSSPSSESSILP